MTQYIKSTGGLNMYTTDKTDKDTILVDTGYLDCMNDHIEITLKRKTSGKYILTDEGATHYSTFITPEKIKEVVDVYSNKYFKVVFTESNSIEVEVDPLDIVCDLRNLTQVLISIHTNWRIFRSKLS